MIFKPVSWLALVAGLYVSTAARAAEDRSTDNGEDSAQIVVTGARDAPTLTEPSDTGSRLGLTPLETPASIQTLTGAAIRDRGDRSIVEAVTRAAGVSSQSTPGNGGNGLTARGFVGVGSVMQLYDGIQLFVGAGTVTFPFDPWTVDRIEVLGGPASVLYGSGAIGGVVNIVSRQPRTDASERSLQLATGTDRTIRAAADLTGPIDEKLAYRLDVSHNRSNGYVARGDSDSTAVSAKLRFAASETLAFTLSDDFGEQQPMNYYGIPTIDGVIDRSRRRVNYNLNDAETEFTDNWLQFRTEWTPADNITIRDVAYHITAKRHWKRVDAYNYVPASGLIRRTNYLEIFHHQRQTGNHIDAVVHGPLLGFENDFSLGSDYNRVRFEHVNNAPYGGSSLTDIRNQTPGTFINLAGTYPRYRTHSTQYSLYAEDRVTLVPGLALAGGIRQDRYTVDRDDLVTATRASRTYNVTSWRIGTTLEVAKNNVLYAQYAVANDSVGNLISLSAQQQSFDLARGRQIEVGYKSAFLNGRGAFTLAAYHIRKRKLLVADVLNPGLSQQVGQQSSKGIEASLTLIPTDGVKIEANGTILQARFDDFAESLGGVRFVRDGNRPPNVPQQTANLWASWQFAATLRVQGGVRYVGKRYINNANTLILPSYAVLDAGVRWQPNAILDVDLRVSNALDRLYATAPWNNGGGAQWILARPRAIEVGLTGHF